VQQPQTRIELLLRKGPEVDADHRGEGGQRGLLLLTGTGKQGQFMQQLHGANKI
jgi:hypothetical protein